MSSASQSSTREVSPATTSAFSSRSEEHTSELQSLAYLVCRLLLEKKKNILLALRGPDPLHNIGAPERRARPRVDEDREVVRASVSVSDLYTCRPPVCSLVGGVYDA